MHPYCDLPILLSQVATASFVLWLVYMYKIKRTFSLHIPG